MIADSSYIKLYVNGVAATHTRNINPTAITSFKIGNYRGWTDRNFKGEIDEVCIWNRALTDAEVRGLRHLTKETQANNGDLLAYYQFNENLNSKITDNAGIKHANLANGADLIPSTAPVGTGRSQTANIVTTNSYSFVNAGIDIDFGSTVPNGEIVLTQIYLQPDSMPSSNFNGLNNYWIINNYGTNANFTIDSIRLYPYGQAISTTVQNNSALSELYFRNSENAFKNQWSTACFGASAADSSVQFAGTACGIGRSGQFWMTADNSPISNITPTQTAMNVFPNPALSGAYLFIDTKAEKIRFRLFDSSGKLVKDQKFENNNENTVVPIPELPEGIYFYRVETESSIQSGKIHIRKN
jgi:hypothetical protein